MGTAPSTGEGRIRAARFPARKSLEDFDYDHARGLKRETIAHLGAPDFVLAKENVILLGPPGTGKTHLARHLPLGGPGGRPSLSPPRRRLPADTGGARLGRGPWPLAAGPWFEIPRSRVQVPVGVPIAVTARVEWKRDSVTLRARSPGRWSHEFRSLIFANGSGRRSLTGAQRRHLERSKGSVRHRVSTKRQNRSRPAQHRCRCSHRT